MESSPWRFGNPFSRLQPPLTEGVVLTWRQLLQLKSLKPDISAEHTGHYEVIYGLRRLRAKGTVISILHAMAFPVRGRPAATMEYDPEEMGHPRRHWRFPYLFSSPDHTRALE